MNFSRSIAFLLLIAVAPNCIASTRIGVVSLLGDNITINYIGPTIFNNKEIEVFEKDWQVNETILDTYAKKSSASGKAVLVPLRGHGLKKGAVNESREFLKGTFLSEHDIKILSDLGKKMAVDQVLVIVPSKQQDTITNSPVLITGYGILYRNKRIYTYVSAGVYLVDVANQKLVDKSVLWAWEEFLGERPLTKLEKDEIYEFVSDEIGSKVVLEKWKGTVLVPNSSPKYKKQILKKYEEENYTDEFVSDKLMLLEQLLYPLHHKFNEFPTLPQAEKGKIKTALYGNLGSAIDASFKAMFVKPVQYNNEDEEEESGD